MSILVGNWVDITEQYKDEGQTEINDSIGTLYFDTKEAYLYKKIGNIPATNNFEYVEDEDEYGDRETIWAYGYVRTQEDANALNAIYLSWGGGSPFEQPGWYESEDYKFETIKGFTENSALPIFSFKFGPEQGTEEDFNKIKDIISQFFIIMN